MHRYMMVAAAAFALASSALTPAKADETCLPDARGAQCDVLLDERRADDVPVGTTNVWLNDRAVLERPLELSGDAKPSQRYGDDVIYWDGDSAMIVPDESGPRLEIADW